MKGQEMGYVAKYAAKPSCAIFSCKKENGFFSHLDLYTSILFFSPNEMEEKTGVLGKMQWFSSGLCTLCQIPVPLTSSVEHLVEPRHNAGHIYRGAGHAWKSSYEAAALKQSLLEPWSQPWSHGWHWRTHCLCYPIWGNLHHKCRG